jgi:DNA-binding NarL/FixJ family response regulator
LDDNAMNALAPKVSPGFAPATPTPHVGGSDAIVVATPDAGWAATVLSALALDLSPPAPVRRVERMSEVADELGQPPQSVARLWIVDEAWLAPVLAQRRLAPAGAPQPGLLVRFDALATERVVAVVESGARGCLPANASVTETRDAVRAVLAGELWLSRKLFGAVLEHLQGRLLPSPPRTAEEAEPDADGLTGRQREIVACVQRGMSNKQIGRHLGISPTTVKTHLHNIFERLGVGGRTLLALRAGDRAH